VAPLLCWDIYAEGINNSCKGHDLPIGGFQQQSLIDYPGNIASVIFTKGCNFRCRYCHNPELVSPDLIKKLPSIDANLVLNWICNNKKLLDAVVITGGEPTLHHSLPFFLKKIKALGLKIKLDTNGTNPDMLQRLTDARLVDYIAMDIKAPLLLNKHRMIAGKHLTSEIIDKIKNSVRIIMQAGCHYEFRTTLDAALDHKDIEEILQLISGRYYLQYVQQGKKMLQQNPEQYSNQNIKKLLEKTYSHVQLSLRD